MSSPPITRYTPEQYLERERKAEFRSEYRDGEIVPMPASNNSRRRIIMNLVHLFSAQLGDGAQEVLAKDMRVKIATEGFCLYTYPDVLVTGKHIDLEDEHEDTLLNPVIVADVFASDNAAVNVGLKMREYDRLASLKEYLGIMPDRPYVYHCQRLPKRRLLLRSTEGLDATVRLEAAPCELPISQIYDRVNFAPERM